MESESEAQHPVRRYGPGDIAPASGGRIRSSLDELLKPSAMDESIEGILDVVDRDDSGPATQPDDDGVLRQTYCYLPIPHLPPGWHILQSWSTKKLDAGVP
ncbi:hypothetical protein B0H13DRAFT_2300688 [Mycena leptocephala]|nr:hypothetical protein B0H13DRAFT_2300688 [Mycena leptocephala]